MNDNEKSLFTIRQTSFGSPLTHTFSFYTSRFQSPSLKLTDWHFKFVYLLLKRKLQTFIIIQSNSFKKSQKMSLFWLKTPLKKHLVTFDNKRADIESKQGLKATGLYIILTKELLYSLTSFPLIWAPLLQKVRRVKWKGVYEGWSKASLFYGHHKITFSI